MIDLQNIYKVYVTGDTSVYAINNVSIKINKGEFVAIMGASGSGKTTLMNILGCLDTPTKGSYFLDGVEINKLSKNQLAEIRNKKIGFVFQSFNLISRTSALENVELPLIYNSKVSRTKARERALSTLKAVGLFHRAHYFPNQLSGGQQHRVAIARAIINEPLIILADEPTGNLDSHTSIEIMAIFQKLNMNNITIVLVTHEHDIAQYAKRNIMFKDGQIISDIYLDNPKNALHELNALSEHKRLTNENI